MSCLNRPAVKADAFCMPCSRLPQPYEAPRPLHPDDITSFQTRPCDSLFEDIHRAAEELRPELDNFWFAVNKVDSKMRRWHSDPLVPTYDDTPACLCRSESEPYMTDCGKLCSRVEPAELQAFQSHNRRTGSKNAKSLPAEQRFRGRVNLSAGDATSSKPSLCSFDSTSLVLVGGDNWETELVRLPLDHIVISIQTCKPSSFQVRVHSDSSFQCDTRICLDVFSAEARDKWLSAFWECKARIEGWDESACYCSPRYVRDRVAPLVAWL